MSYVTSTYLAWLRPRLTPRDLVIIENVGRFKLMSSSQILRLFFYERADTGEVASPLSMARKCQATLNRLTKLGVLARLDERDDAAKGFIYCLDIAGQHIAGLTSSRPRRKYSWHSPLIPHTLAVPELAARLIEAHRTGIITLHRYDGEPKCWRRFAEYELKPDAYAELDEVEGAKRYRSNWYVEIDRGSQWGKQIRNKFPIYNLFWAYLEGKGRKSRGCLILVTTEARKRYFEIRIRQQPERLRSLYTVALFDDALDVLKG